MTLADIRQGLRAYLLAGGTISSRVGAGRIFPLVLPQGQVLDSIVYSRISGLGDHHSQGASGLSRPRFQIDCWSKTPDGADSLALLVKERIDGFRGVMEYGTTSPPSEVKVQGVFFDSEREDYDDTVKMFRSSKDYLIWFEER